jgi:hypothetical protein
MIERLIRGQPDLQAEIVGGVVHGERKRDGAGDGDHHSHEQPTAHYIEEAGAVRRHRAARC